jgi:Tetratricopeptide repeat
MYVLETGKRVLGGEHLDTLTSMNNLAFIWKFQGRDAEALALIEECVQIRKRTLGFNHPSTASLLLTLKEWQMNNIGSASDT